MIDDTASDPNIEVDSCASLARATRVANTVSAIEPSALV